VSHVIHPDTSQTAPEISSAYPEEPILGDPELRLKPVEGTIALGSGRLGPRAG